MKYFLLFLSLFHLKFSYAHEGHDHGIPLNESNSSGPITLSETSIQNLEIRTTEAAIQPLQPSLEMPAYLEALPEKKLKLNVRFSGRVIGLLVKQGEFVTNQQALLQLEPSTLGNPTITLKANQEGWITAINLTLGQSFSSETTLLEITDYRSLLAQGIAYETKDFLKIKSGYKAYFKAAIEPNLIYTGIVQRVDAALQTESRTFQVYVEINNSDLILRPNFQGTLFINLGEAQNILAIPQQAILGELGNYFVFVQEGNTFEKRFVTLGIKVSDQIEILSGILPGEQVVIQGNYQLQYVPTSPMTPKKL